MSGPDPRAVALDFDFPLPFVQHRLLQLALRGAATMRLGLGMRLEPGPWVLADLDIRVGALSFLLAGILGPARKRGRDLARFESVVFFDARHLACEQGMRRQGQ